MNVTADVYAAEVKKGVGPYATVGASDAPIHPFIRPSTKTWRPPLGPPQLDEYESCRTRSLLSVCLTTGVPITTALGFAGSWKASTCEYSLMVDLPPRASAYTNSRKVAFGLGVTAA